VGYGAATTASARNTFKPTSMSSRSGSIGGSTRLTRSGRCSELAVGLPHRLMRGYIRASGSILSAAVITVWWREEREQNGRDRCTLGKAREWNERATTASFSYGAVLLGVSRISLRVWDLLRISVHAARWKVCILLVS